MRRWRIGSTSRTGQEGEWERRDEETRDKARCCGGKGSCVRKTDTQMRTWRVRAERDDTARSGEE
jgi:hypothetical protein